MLDEYKKNIRKPNPEELRLIKFLVQKASLNMSEGWERSLTVSCLNDGGIIYVFTAERNNINDFCQ